MNESITVMGTQDYLRVLQEACSEIGHYGWIWAILRWRARQTGYTPRQLVPILLRFTNPRRPLFVGKSEGIRFLGRCDDRYSVDHAVVPGDAASIARQIVLRLRERDGAFLDVGANVGLVSAMAAHAMPQRAIYAFEPGAETSRRAAATFALNHLENVSLLPLAVGDEDGELTFYNAPGHSDFATANPADFSNSDPNRPQVVLQWVESRVPVCRLDTLLTEINLPSVGLIKIDVEGHELKVLTGAKNLIARDRPDILLEWNPDIATKLGWKPQDAADLLNTITPYQCFTLSEDGKRGAFPPPAGETMLVNILAIAQR